MLFEEFHDLAKRDHVSDEFLRKMATEDAMLVAKVQVFGLEMGGRSGRSLQRLF